MGGQKKVSAVVFWSGVVVRLRVWESRATTNDDVFGGGLVL